MRAGGRLIVLNYLRGRPHPPLMARVVSEGKGYTLVSGVIGALALSESVRISFSVFPVEAGRQPPIWGPATWRRPNPSNLIRRGQKAINESIAKSNLLLLLNANFC